MGIFDKFKKNKGGDKKIPMPMYLYDDAEINELDKYIAEKFGKFDNVFHELISPDVHLDVCMIPRKMSLTRSSLRWGRVLIRWLSLISGKNTISTMPST